MCGRKSEPDVSGYTRGLALGFDRTSLKVWDREHTSPSVQGSGMSYNDTQVNWAGVPSPKTSYSLTSNEAHIGPHQEGCPLGRGLLAAVKISSGPSWMASPRQEPSRRQPPTTCSTQVLVLGKVAGCNSLGHRALPL